eukprot:5350119-Pyramimonas_sp.AAC.1
MVSDNAADEAFYLPEGTCWVEADNEKMKPEEAMDSRHFGPIDYNNVIGRAMYFYRSDVDHGSVENRGINLYGVSLKSRVKAKP